MGKENIGNKWNYYAPTFEFTKDLPIDSSAWSGHYFFAYDLVRNIKPKVIVELGTHKGNSLFSMAQAIKDGNLKTKLHAVDTWEGDSQAGFYGEDIYKDFLKISKKYYQNVEIVPHKMLFDDALKSFKDNSIEILHIDGLHTYEAVKHDFETWLPKVKKDTGVIMFHDVCEIQKDFGVYRLWEELKKKYKDKITFEHYHGLGVVFLGSCTTDIQKYFPHYYAALSKNQDYNYSLKLLEEKNKELEKNIFEIHKTIEEMHNNIARYQKKEQVWNKKEVIMNEYKIEVEEFRSFKKGYIWKILVIGRKLKKYLKNFFINIRNDGVTFTFKRMFIKTKNIIRYRRKIYMEKNSYKYWLKNNTINRERRKRIQEEINTLKYHPLISIVMPVYNVDLKWFKEAIKSIKQQIYTNWELCIADDASTNPQLIKYLKYLSEDKKIKIIFREKNGHISEATNSALELATGSFVAFMDNDDYIYPHALAEVVKVLNEKPETDFIYSDEDKLEITGERVSPFFKPDWSPDLFMSTNYLCHLTVARKEIVDLVGGFRKGYEGSQDYDLYLRITEKTDKIEHIPDILYSWRKIPGSTATQYKDKNYAEKTTLKALKDSLKRRKTRGEVFTGLFPGSFRVKYNIIGKPLVSIIIPTKDKNKYIERCISSIFAKTTYYNYEILIVDTGSTEKETLEYYKTIKENPKIRFLYWKKNFNYSSVNNFGVKHSKGEYILLLNNDTEVITPNWIENLLEHAQRRRIGAVGAKLYYPDYKIQHAGIVLGINSGEGRGVAGHAFKFHTNKIQGFPIQKDIIRNYSGVTAACLMIQKKKFKEVGGLEEKLRIAFNDVDFCLKLLEKGYYNIYTPYTELYHHESISVGTPESQTRDIDEFKKEIDTMYERWEDKLLNDSFYNKNLSLRSEDFRIKIDTE